MTRQVASKDLSSKIQHFEDKTFEERLGEARVLDRFGDWRLKRLWFKEFGL